MTTQSTVLITGASSGLGLAFAHEFARKSYNIVMVSNDPGRLETSRREIERIAKGSVRALSINLAKADAGEELFLRLQKEKITIDILINSAGFGTTGPLLEANPQEQIEQITLNSIIPTVLSALFAKDMVKRGKGKILNVASMAAFAPGPFMAVYYATKSYLFRFSTALNYELKDTGVTVSTFCPGPVSTNFANRAHATKTRLFSRHLPSANEVVRVAIKGLGRNKPIIFDSRRNAAMALLLRIIPLKTSLKITTKLNQ